MTRAPTIAVKATRARDLQQRERDRDPQRLIGLVACRTSPAAARAPAPSARPGRRASQPRRGRRACAARCDRTARGSRRPCWRRTARCRRRSRRPVVQPSDVASHAPSSVAITLWPIAPGTATPAHRQQLLDVELQADAEHQQDDADLGELFGHRRIDGQARRVRAEQRAGEQVADDRRQAQPLRDVAKDERAGKAAREGEDQVVFVHCGPSLTDPPLASGRRAGARVCGERFP